MSNRIEYSFDKNRKVEESYKFTLPELYRKIALEELREDDVVREQALTQMREWIISNPNIRKCRDECSGRTVLLMQVIRMERARLTPLQEGRFIFLLLEALLELEEIQIGGILLLLDYTGISMGTYQNWGEMEVKITFDGIGRFYPVRYREIHAANVPKVVDSFVEYLITVAPSAFKEKIHCHTTVDKLKELMGPSMTPQAYGGCVDLDELNKKFWKRFGQQYEGFALGLDNFEINLDHYFAVWSKENLNMTEGFEKEQY